MENFFSPSIQSMDMNCRSISAKRYMPLIFDVIHGLPNAMPYDLRKHFHKFGGNHLDSASHHVQMFSDLIGDFEITHEDVHMKLFVQTLEGDARDWFSFFPTCFVSSWDEFHSAFMKQFKERVSISDSFENFLKIQIRNDELVPKFNIRFVKVLDEIPESCKPNDQVFLVVILMHLIKI